MSWSSTMWTNPPKTDGDDMAAMGPYPQRRDDFHPPVFSRSCGTTPIWERAPRTASWAIFRPFPCGTELQRQLRP